MLHGCFTLDEKIHIDRSSKYAIKGKLTTVLSSETTKLREVQHHFQGFTQALFAATVFHLRLSLKCSCGSGGRCRLCLK